MTSIRSPRRWLVVALCLAVLAIVIVLALIIKAHPWGDAERNAIDRARASNLSLARHAQALPGTPDLANLAGRLAEQGLTLGAPVLIRIFKREFELELWMARDGRYQRFATYPICRWSGWLGPKVAHGDRQAPEGFYTVAPDQLNPNSRWHRSFDVGFPNAYDRAHGRTGSSLMVHGGCSSAGCYAMTNAVIDEIWRLTQASLVTVNANALVTAVKPTSTVAVAPPKIKRFQVQIFPFSMTEDALLSHENSPHIAFWRQLKVGSDLFEATLLPPVAATCGGNYKFSAGGSVEPVGVQQSCQTATSQSTPRMKKPL